MVALGDDALQALWAIFDASGIRPEYLVPVLYFESGFDSTKPNAAGAPYYGIAQTSGTKLASLGTSPSAYLAMSQGDQIRLAVAPYFAGVVKSYGPIASATRAEQANFLPASLATVRGLSQVLQWGGSRVYAANAAALDPRGHGAITLADLAAVMSRAASSAPARAATARAYQLRTTAGAPRNPVYGTDFASPALSLGALALAVGWAATR